jgi:TP901 family phage tail tape measure protein
MLPLLATAALSNSFREVVQTGRVVEQQLAIIGALGGATGEQVDGLRNRITELARSGPVGVTEIAEAMKVLSLAGMQANEILGATQVVLDFSVAGTTDLKTAAETLMSVSTAFNMGSGGFREVSDVISKAAAESMTSVENFSSAMKTASVINAQYGVSLKDTAVNIAALSQLGIQASAAGTAVRNMYADLSGRSTQVAKVLKQQGIELRDNNGKFRDLVTIVGELDDKFSKLTGKGKANLMQALLSERGAKPIVELLRMVQTEATVTGKSFSNALEEMRGKLDNIGGFSAEAAARLNQTADNQLKSVTSSFSATMLDAYKSIEPSLIVIATNLKALFADDTFKAFLSGMANFMATLGRVVSENIGAFTLLAGVYAASKVAGWALAFVTDKLSVEKKKLLTLTLENGAAMTIEATAENRSLASKYALIRAEQALNKEKQAGTLITQGNAAKTTATGLAGAAVGVAGVAGAAVAGAGIVDAAGNVIRSQKGIADATDAATRATVDNGKETAKDMSTKMKWIGWLGRAAGALNYVGMAITLGTVGYSLYEMWQNKSADAASRAASITENNVATAMNKEADMLERINSLMATGLSLRDATARASVMGTAPSELDAAKTKLESLKEQKKLYDKTYGSQISAASSGTEVSRVASNGAALDREITATTAQVAKLERPVTEATNRLKLANAEREKLIKAEEDRRKKAITGTGMFELGQGANGGGLRQQGANAFDSLIKGFNEASRSAIAAAKDQQALMDGFPATLPYLKAFENDLEKIDEQFEMAKKNMKPDAEGYAQAVKQLELGRLMARAAAEQKKNDAEYAYGVAETKKALEEYAVAVAKVVELKRADARAAWEATRAYEAERAEKERSFKVMEDDAKAKDAQRGMTPADAAAYAAQYEIQKKYAGERFKIEQELQKDLEGLVDQDGIEDYQAANRKILQANKKLADLEKDRAKETSIATAQVYKEEWQKTTDSIASDLTNRLMEGTLDAGDFLKDTFKNLVLRPQMELAMKGLMDGVFGGMGGGSSGGGGIFGFLGSLFSFDGGGYTGDGSRSGGLDGKGGFLAMLHPQETVTDHTKGQAVESSSAPVTVIINNTVGDVATKSMLDQYQQSTVKQVQAGLMRSSRYGGAASA